MSDSAQDRLARRSDFAAALWAGVGNTVGTVERDRFDNFLESGEFKKSGLHDVADGLVAKIDQLLSLNQIIRDAFNYGRQFEEVF